MTNEEIKFQRKITKQFFIATILFFILLFAIIKYEESKEYREKQKAVQQMETEIKYEIYNEYINSTNP